MHHRTNIICSHGKLRAATLALVVSAFVATGCMRVGPDYMNPEISVEPEWVTTRDAEVVTTAPLASEWWKSFNDPVLERLVTRVRESNLTLQAAGLRIYEARANLGVAVGNFYPNQQLQGDYTWTHPSRVGTTAPQPGSGLGSPDVLQSSAGFAATWEPDFWGKYSRLTEAAAATLQSTVADYNAALASLTAEVASTYVQYRTLQQQYLIALANVDIQRENLRIATVRFQLGATSDRDVQQAQAQLSSTEGTIPGLRSSLTQKGNALCTLLAIPPGNLDELFGAGPIPVAPGQVAVGIPADLLRRRPDVRSAEFTAMAACAQVGATKADLFPAFTLGGFVGFSASNVGAFSISDTFGRGYTANVGPSVTLPFFNYGRITNAVRARDAAYQGALASYRNTVLGALADAESSLDTFLQSRLRVGFYATSSRAAQESLKLALIQYRDGATDFTTVLTAAATLADSQNTLAQAQGSVALGLVGLYRALGGGWEQPGEFKPVPDAVLVEMRARTNWGNLLRDPKGFPPSESGPHLPDF